MEEFGLYDSLFEPIAVIDDKFEILYFNHSFVTFSHLSPRQIKQKKYLPEIIQVEALPLAEHLLLCQQKNTSIVGPEGAIELKAPTSTAALLQYHGTIKITAHGSYYILSINDLSIEKRLHQKYRAQLNELKESHQQIINADKLATLGELTAGISHEISNPLTIANGSCEIIEMCLEESDLNREREQIIQSLNDVKESHSRINSIIINMKNYLHQGRDQEEYFHLRDVVDHSIALVTPSFKDQQIQIAKEHFDETILLYGNPIKFEQVLVNLLKNALFAISHSATQDGKVTISAHRAINGKIEIRVADNGPGITKEIAPQIFNTFFTTKDVGEGTGMGLSISQKIIAQHMGTIDLDINTKEGAAFIISLPALEITQFTQDQMKINNISPNRHDTPLRVLVIDDELKILSLFKNFFENTKHHLYTAETPTGALEQLKRVEMDIIISDYSMPEMSGTALAELIRKQGIHCPIFYLTDQENAKHYDLDRQNLKIAGIIYKPFTREQVMKALEIKPC